jgi:ABC-2 type transport system permease protein
VSNEVPNDADILFISMPERDWTVIKTERITNFLINEGKVFFALDYRQAMPNLADVLDAYGLTLKDNLIFEDDERKVLMLQIVPRIIPTSIEHEITANLQERQFVNLVPFFPVELALNDLRKTTLEIEPLWTTSPDSFSRNISSEAETMKQVSDDVPGPFNLALAITDRIFIDGTTYYTRLVVVNNVEFMDLRYNSLVGTGNWHFVLNSLQWMSNQSSGVLIPSRMPPGQMPLAITSFEAGIISITVLGGIPLIIIAAGFFVWLKRRNA